MISVQKVKPSASVIIHGARSLSHDMATLHFENPRRSGGGDVKNVRRNGDGDIIIEFCDRSGNAGFTIITFLHKLLIYCIFY